MTPISISCPRTFWLNWDRFPHRSFRLIIPRKFRRVIPSSWSELTGKQAIMFTRLLFQGWSPGSTLGSYQLDFRIDFLRAVLRLRGSIFYNLDKYHITELINIMKPVFEGDSSYPALRRFLIGFTWHYLPCKTLQYSPFIEFALAEDCYRRVLSGDNSALDELVSHLCRPRWRKERHAGETNDPRLKYDSELQEQIYLKLSRGIKWHHRIPNEIKLYVYFFYHSCRQQLIKRYPNAFAQQGDSSRGGPDFTSKYGWIGHIDNLAETGPFGDWDQVCYTEVHKVLHYINYTQDRALEARLHAQIAKK